MTFDEIVSRLKKIDPSLSKRFSIINSIAKYPTVYVEIQSFFQNFFKFIIQGDYFSYGIECYVANANLGKYLSSEAFVHFARTKYGVNFDLVTRLNYLANSHKHNSVVALEPNDVLSYHKEVYSLSAALIREFQRVAVPPYSESEFNDLFKSQDLKKTNDDIELLKDEIKKQKLLLKNMEKDEEEYKEALSRIESLDAIVLEKTKEIEELEKQVIELSRHNEYEKNSVFGFSLPPQDVFSTNFYEKAIKAKRNGDFEYALEIYGHVFKENGCVYDYDLLKAIFKVGMLARKFDLCEAILKSFLHYEINYFMKTMSSEGKELDRLLLTSRINDFMNSNRYFKSRWSEDMSERRVPSSVLVGSYSTEIMTYYYFLVMAKDSYNEILDSFGLNGDIVRSYLYLLQHGTCRTEKESLAIDTIRLKIERTDLLYDLTISLMKKLDHHQLGNLAVVSIYKINSFL